MSDTLRKDLLNAIRPVARANGTVSSVVERLAANVDSVQDPELRNLLLNAAAELLGATKEINGALAKVVETR